MQHVQYVFPEILLVPSDMTLSLLRARLAAPEAVVLRGEDICSTAGALQSQDAHSAPAPIAVVVPTVAAATARAAAAAAAAAVAIATIVADSWRRRSRRRRSRRRRSRRRRSRRRQRPCRHRRGGSTALGSCSLTQNSWHRSWASQSRAGSRGGRRRSRRRRHSYRCTCRLLGLGGRTGRGRRRPVSTAPAASVALLEAAPRSSAQTWSPAGLDFSSSSMAFRIMSTCSLSCCSLK